MQNNAYSIRKEAQNLRSNGEYEKAVKLFKQLWYHSESKDKWDGWGLAFCLNKLKQYEEAFAVSSEVHQLAPNFDHNRSQFTWSSYMVNVKNFPDNGNPSQLARNAYEILKISENKRDDLFRIKTVLKMMEFSANSNYWEKVIEWAENIDPKDLSTNVFSGMSSDGKKFTKPSDKEVYYLKMAKALYKLGRYGECLTLCNKGLECFHNEPWLMWHKGISLSKLGNYDEAVSVLQKTRLIKKDWFILRDLSAAYYKKRSYNDALGVFLDAAIDSVKIPNPENRWELYYLGAKIYDKLGKQNLSEKHFTLVYKLRKENHWKINDFLEAEVSKLKIDESLTSSTLLKELYQIWQSELQDLIPLKRGVVKNFIAGGTAGFIKTDDGDIFFRTKNTKDGKHKLKVGDQVELQTRKSFDKSKNKESLEAVHIKIIT